MASTTLKTTVILLLFTSVIAIVIGQKCKTPYNSAKDFPIKPGSFIVLYNISSAEKTDQSCFEIRDYHGLNTDVFTFKFNKDGSEIVKKVDVKIIGRNAFLIFQDDPTHVLDMYDEILPNGVILAHFCRESQEFTLLGYPDYMSLTKETDEAAKNYSKNPSAYKINRDNC